MQALASFSCLPLTPFCANSASYLPSFSKHRQILLEIFSKNYRVRRNVIQNQLAQGYGEDLDKQEVDKVLKVSVVHAFKCKIAVAGLVEFCYLLLIL